MVPLLGLLIATLFTYIPLLFLLLRAFACPMSIAQTGKAFRTLHCFDGWVDSGLTFMLLNHFKGNFNLYGAILGPVTFFITQVALISFDVLSVHSVGGTLINNYSFWRLGPR